MKIKFRCPDPDCRYHKTGYGFIEEVMVDVCQFSVISDIEQITDTTAGIDYGDLSYNGGIVEGYVCGHCGFVLAKEPFDIPITKGHELLKWLKDKGMLSV